jgi:hypothetical protein
MMVDIPKSNQDDLSSYAPLELRQWVFVGSSACGFAVRTLEKLLIEFLESARLPRTEAGMPHR